MKTTRWLAALGILLLWVRPPLGADRPQKRPAPQYAEFLSQVRYLISPEERKAFLSLPDAQKLQFIEDFWRKRDPDPATPTNEFKEEYLQRIRQANETFIGESQPGWLTDRGRVYILYGPPSRRDKTPLAGQTGPCGETWHYRNIPVTFSDRTCSGTYTLTSLDLSPLSDLNVALAASGRAARPETKLPFDFNIRILKKPLQGEKFEGLVVLETPYSEIWFDVQEGKFKTTFTVEMELADSQKAVRWQYKNSYSLTLTAAELKENQKNKYRIEVPMTVEKDVAALRAGKNRLTILITNETSKEKIRKVAEFSL
jgi:GWxTD domain-containing protein